MRAADFRRLALALPGASEFFHMGHPDFRIGTRVFATLDYPGEGWAMVKLSPDQQASMLASRPDAFRPAKGAWGARGSTQVLLGAADAASVSGALRLAWEGASASPGAGAKRRKRSSAPPAPGDPVRAPLDWDSVAAHAVALGGAELAQHYGRPAVKVDGRAVLGIGREAGSFVLHIDTDTKQLLLETNPRTYWQTTHYRGWPTVLVRYDTPDRAHVLSMIERACQQAKALAPSRARKSAGSRPSRRGKRAR